VKSYDIVIFGNFTKDTIISSTGTRQVGGGGFNYGAQAARRTGLEVAAVTRLAKEDASILKDLEQAGIAVYPTFTPHSTHMTLDYPNSNPDERILTTPQTAGSYTPQQFAGLSARAWLINGSVRGETPAEVVEYLHQQDGLLVADAQGFIRVISEDKTLENRPWPEKEYILSMIDILKVDIVEAESLTGEKDIFKAAKMIHEWGPSEVVLTHRNGILVYAGESYFEAEFHPDELIGRSGRGDTCIASYTAKRLSADPAAAIIWSAALTSLKMEAEGPFKGSYEDVEKKIAKAYQQLELS